MITITKGNMFDQPFDIRVNTVNCKGVMGKGIALEFKKRYPDLFQAYKVICKDKQLKPGHLHIYQPKPGMWVINFATKDHWRNMSQYDWIESGLEKLKEFLLNHPRLSIAIPALGCSNGGLSWPLIKLKIEHALKGLNNNIVLFEPL